MGDRALENFVFNIGMIEMISYWKATCSPKIEIRAGKLTREQKTWWKNFIIKGMGQFFYENQIDWRSKNFLRLDAELTPKAQQFRGELKDRYLVPFAGGRDSIVTLEKLKEKKSEAGLFTVNPIEKINKCIDVSGIENKITVIRQVDKNLLEMNELGFLNGHTPFTGLLSFIAVFCAALFDYKHIAFSNEKSANEGNTTYLGRKINHQWAKSSEFEKMFQEYAQKYLSQKAHYFSYLRKYGELEISKMFSRYKKYFPVFSSCNAGMKISKRGTLAAEERWCGNCPKCLFVYLSLYPFLKKEDLDLIFGQNIFENKKLLPAARDLLEKNRVKPFECVGTRKETLRAFDLAVKKQKGKKLPYLLEYFESRINC